MPPNPLCIDDKCAGVSESAPSGTIKWNPGHYMLPFRGDSHRTLVDKRVAEVCSEPALRGMQVRLDWHTLESTKGVYTFGEVEELYRSLAECKKHLVLEVWPVEFNTTSPEGIVPDYLRKEAIYNGGLAKTGTGYIARLWERPVMDRMIALNDALAARFDSEPYFEGIILTETATGFDGLPDSYSAAAYVAEMKRFVASRPQFWQRTNIIVFNNFIQAGNDALFADFVQWLHDHRASTGGPDTLPPPSDGSKGERIYRGEIGGVDRRGKMPAMWAVQSSQFSGKQGSWLPSELRDHCVGTNRCSHMFWLRNTAYGTAAQQWDTGILPFLRKMPPTSVACPASYQGRCASSRSP
jgi:hypothetical protein